MRRMTLLGRNLSVNFKPRVLILATLLALAVAIATALGLLWKPAPASAQAPTAVAAGGFHTCTVVNGGVQCRGRNFSGELGDGTTIDKYMFVNVSGLTSGVAAVAAGFLHTCALTTTGGVKCWGRNNFGQLGDGTTTDSTTPVDVSGLTTGVDAVATGGRYTCARTTTGGVQCWGANSSGQLGDGTTTDSSTPVDVCADATCNTALSGVTAVAAGGPNTCALTTTGGLKCWGRNNFGQLGDGTTTDSPTPADVSGLTSGVTAVPVGLFHTCAVTTTGGAKCWGRNDFGQLGDGTTTDSTIPVDVSGLTTGVDAASAGGLHACALTTTGSVECWGDNTFGQAGVTLAPGFEIEVFAKGFTYPQGVAVNSGGDVFVADNFGQKVYRIPPTGALPVGPPNIFISPISWPDALVFRTINNVEYLFVTQSGAGVFSFHEPGTVSQFDSTGNFVSTFANITDADGIAFAGAGSPLGEGSALVGAGRDDQAVLKVDSAAVVTTFKSTLPDCGNPDDVALNSGGNLVFVGCGGGPAPVLKIQVLPSGQADAITTIALDQGTPFALTMRGDDTLFVGVLSGNTGTVFELPSPYTGPANVFATAIRGISGLAFGPDGALYVSRRPFFAGGNVLKISSDPPTFNCISSIIDSPVNDNVVVIGTCTITDTGVVNGNVDVQPGATLILRGSVQGNIELGEPGCAQASDLELEDGALVTGNVIQQCPGDVNFTGDSNGAQVNGNVEMNNGILRADEDSQANQVSGNIICNGGTPAQGLSSGSASDWDGDGAADGALNGNYLC